MTYEELKEKRIPCWTDNDGGLWYWGDDHQQKTVKED